MMKHRARVALLAALLLAFIANASARVQAPECPMERATAASSGEHTGVAETGSETHGTQPHAHGAFHDAGHAGHQHHGHSDRYNSDDCDGHHAHAPEVHGEHTGSHDGHLNCPSSCVLSCALAAGASVLPGSGAPHFLAAAAIQPLPPADQVLHGLQAPPFRPPRPAAV